MKKVEKKYDWELLVIGGGSGGIACAKEAGEILGPGKVAMLDFVKPTPQGTTWGVGGTCVNVGCIPKKLCHHAALLGEYVDYSKHYGWTGIDHKNVKVNWQVLTENVQNHILAINYGYRKMNLPDYNVKYINAFGTFIDAHTVETTSKSGKKEKITAKNIVIAVGGRPRIPKIPGSEYVITSDDIWQLPKHPQKTLIVGASYVSLECAGFLKGVGSDVTVAVRSILLRGFDQQIAELIGKYMEKKGIKFKRPATVNKIEKLDNGKLKATLLINKGGNAVVETDEFDTIMYAIGRTASTKELNLDKVGVKVNERNGKIIANNETTTTPNIFAIGDVLDGKLELTPVAIKAGRRLAQRLFNNSKLQMDYVNVPTTVFTPLEYGAVGLAEEDAIKKYGAENIEVYHTKYTPLEWTVGERGENICYAKIICNLQDNEKIVGFHVLGEHAGEITQGFGVAIKAGATKQQFDDTVGIHPTSAEEFTTLHITKRSGKSAEKSTC